MSTNGKWNVVASVEQDKLDAVVICGGQNLIVANNSDQAKLRFALANATELSKVEKDPAKTLILEANPING